MSLCCSCPVVVGLTIVFAILWRRGGTVARGVALGGSAFLALMVGLAIYSEGRYIVLDEGLVIDACAGDTAGVLWRLDHGGSPNAKTDDGLGALECATTNGHVAAARVLLQHEADPDARSEAFGDTPRENARRIPEMLRMFAKYPSRPRAGG